MAIPCATDMVTKDRMTMGTTIMVDAKLNIFASQRWPSSLQLQHRAWPL
jgi:hypothetical protein